MEDFLEQEFGQMMAVEVVRDIIAAAEKQVIYNKVSHQLVSSVTQWTMDELICCVEDYYIECDTVDIGNDELWQIDDEPDTVQVDSWASQTWPCLYFKKPLESRQYIIDDSQNIPPQTTSSAVVSTEAIQASESKEPVMNKPESPGTMILKAATATASKKTAKSNNSSIKKNPVSPRKPQVPLKVVSQQTTAPIQSKTKPPVKLPRIPVSGSSITAPSTKPTTTTNAKTTSLIKNAKISAKKPT